MGELLSGQSELVLDRASAGHLAQVMRATAIEMDALRSVPAGMRRAVLGLANALRAAVDPSSAAARHMLRLDDLDAHAAASQSGQSTIHRS
jgi:hypothetical protein